MASASTMIHHTLLSISHYYPVRMHQEYGDTPLHWAYRSKATECIDILLAAWADLEVV